MNPIRKAASIIDQFWFAPRRQRRLMRELGVDDLITRIDVAKAQHRPSKAAQAALSKRLHQRLASELGR